MIISGGSRRGAKWFAGHVMRTDGGQQVRLAEARGLAGYDIPGWFRQMEAVSFGTRCDNFFYHANINPREDERLTEAQWGEAVDRLEENLGLDGHARFVVEHEKEGRVHRHVFWSRIDPDTMTAVSDSKTYRIHEKTADELEAAFGHEPTPRGHETASRNPHNWEVFRGKKDGIDPYDVGAELTELWQQSDNGPSFAAALEAQGYILCEGRRGLCVVDPAGKEHSLARRIEGARKKDIDARMQDVDRSVLPTVEEARAMVRNRPDRDDAAPVSAEPGKRDPDHGGTHARQEPEPPAEAATFDRIARDLLKEERRKPEPAPEPAGGDVSEAAIHRREDTGTSDYLLNLSPFEHVTRDSRQAVHDARDDDELITAGLDWMQRTIGAWITSPTSTSEKRTPFDSVVENTKQALRENGGQPYTGEELSFWQRAKALLTAARDRVAEWMKASWQEIVQRTRGRDVESDDHGLER